MDRDPFDFEPEPVAAETEVERPEGEDDAALFRTETAPFSKGVIMTPPTLARG